MGIGLPHRPWGMLTGVRPGKLMTPLLAQGHGRCAGRALVSSGTTTSRPHAPTLVVRTAHATLRAMDSLGEKDVCLYVGIPFCPTRCAYCSFVSQSVEKSMALVPEFLQALAREIAATAEAVHRAGLRVVSLYIGGGTPTTLSARQLDALCTQLDCGVRPQRPARVHRRGRPARHHHGRQAARAACAPGRPHQRQSRRRSTTACSKRSAAATRRRTSMTLCSLVRATGGFAVNMDLIAGLPGDTPDGFRTTLEQVLALAPENITVHTLSRKRGADLSQQTAPVPDGAQVGEMLDFANTALRHGGLRAVLPLPAEVHVRRI